MTVLAIGLGVVALLLLPLLAWDLLVLVPNLDKQVRMLHERLLVERKRLYESHEIQGRAIRRLKAQLAFTVHAFGEAGELQVAEWEGASQDRKDQWEEMAVKPAARLIS